jgi:hypothetical protein
MREWIIFALLAGFILSGLGACAVAPSGAVYPVTPAQWGVWLPGESTHESARK